MQFKSLKNIESSFRQLRLFYNRQNEMRAV